MAATTRLKLNFTKSNGDAIIISFGNSKTREKISDANIKSLMESIVANGSIFRKIPANIKSAYVITTNSDEIDLS